MLMFMPVVPAILTRNERLSDSLSSRVALSFQWVLGHAGLTDNELADSLTKTGTTLPFTNVPYLLASNIAKIRHTRSLLFWRRNLSHNSLSFQIPLVSSEEVTLLRLIHCELSYSNFAATVTAFSCPLTYAR